MHTIYIYIYICLYKYTGYTGISTDQSALSIAGIPLKQAVIQNPSRPRPSPQERRSQNSVVYSHGFIDTPDNNENANMKIANFVVRI